MADQRSPRDGRFIEMLGHYNPQSEPSEIQLDRERLDHWLARGAQPSNTVRKLMRSENTVVAVAPEPEPEPPEPDAAAEPVAGADAAPEPEPEAEAPPEPEAAQETPAG